jgi:hypothetical protein
MCNFHIFTDPHVRVAGRQVDVKEAKGKVMEILDTKVIILLFEFFGCVYIYMYRVDQEQVYCLLLVIWQLIFTAGAYLTLYQYALHL